MKFPSVVDWSFAKIQAEDRDRADSLDAAGSPGALIETVAAALEQAIDCCAVRIGLDSRNNQFVDCRAIVQFKIDVRVYDWFFNGRAGYRAQFWISHRTGIEFNENMIKALARVLTHRLPPRVIARKIKAIVKGGSREDQDVGETTVSRDFVVRSLEPAASKIWIAERLIQRCGGPIKDIGFSTLSAAARSPKLCIPKWASARNPETGEIGEGLRAPYPAPDYSWLDLKGGFVAGDCTVEQIKPQDARVTALNRRGWT